MKICLAQTKPFTGDIEQNRDQHLLLVEQAVTLQADIIIFPELSLTGYEPLLAERLSLSPDDQRLAPFQQVSNKTQIIIGVGAPVKKAAGITISLLLFQPHQSLAVYAKQYLHPDEEPYFTGGQHTTGLLPGNIALALCYELAVPAHAQNAFEKGARFYVASVAKSSEGVARAGQRLSQIAQDYAVTALLVNCVG